MIITKGGKEGYF